MTDQIYTEVLKVWNSETPDDFAIFSELYYQMFGGEFEILTSHNPPLLLSFPTTDYVY